MRDEIKNAIKEYSHLRNSLFPYIYSMAHKASETALPLCRALSLMYPENPEYDYVLNTYMFGDSMLVSVFKPEVTLPEGLWIDYFTGDVYEGGKTIEYKLPEGRGGAMMIKAGSVFCTMKPTRCIEEKIPDNYFVNVYPGDNGEFTLYEDDGYTYDYKNGGQATTKFTLKDQGDACTLTVAMREGSYEGRVKAEDAPLSTPDINGMVDVTGFKVKVFGAIKAVELDGKAVDFKVCETCGYTVFNVSKEDHENGTLTYKITK
jgi:alpha-glucosidase